MSPNIAPNPEGSTALLTPRPGKPTTKEDFKARGAITLPVDGIKKPGEKCLTCIAQSASCPGTIVLDGKCQNCRGIAIDGSQSRNKRNCCWVEEDKDIWTLSASQEYYGLRRLKQNTREGVAEREAKKARPTEAPVEVKVNIRVTNIDKPSIWDLEEDTEEKRILEKLAVQMISGKKVEIVGLVNTKKMRELAVAEHILTFTGENELSERRRQRAMVAEIFVRLDGMVAREEGITAEEIRELL